MKRLPTLLLGIFIGILIAIGVCYLLQKHNENVAPLKASNQTVIPKLTLFYNAEELPGEKSLVAQVVQSQLGRIGIETSLEPVPSTIYNDRLTNGQFESALTLWYLDYDDAEGFLTDFYSKSSFRLSKYSNPKYDEAYKSALFAPTEKEKFERYHAAADILKRDLPWIPLFSNSELYLMSPKAAGFVANAYQYYDYRWVDMADIRAATDVEIQTLDPALCYDAGSKHLITQSYEGLVAMDEHNQTVPALATEWHFSPKGDRLSFTLRPGVKFHPAPFLSKPGQRNVDAQDVKASFERLIKANSPYGYIFDYVAGVDEFKAGTAKNVSGLIVEAPLKFTIQLKRPFPTMLPWLLAPAAYVLPAELPAKYDFSKGSVGTGPFALKSWDGSLANYAANTDYWRAENGSKLPKAKTLAIRVIKDPNTLFLAYQKSELDILNVPLPVFDAVMDSNGNVKAEWQKHVFREVKLNNLKFIGFNMQGNPWGNSVELRHRVEQAINRDEIVRQLFRGKARAANSIIPQGMAGFAP